MSRPSPELLAQLALAAFAGFWEGDSAPPTWAETPPHKRAVFRNIAIRVVEAGQEYRRKRTAAAAAAEGVSVGGEG